jgi:GNAT superfamily N-acetyltransferase
MNMYKTFCVSIDPPEDEVQELRRNLRLDNLANVGPDKEEVGLAIFLRDNDDNLEAGISGFLWGAVLEIDYLWVHQSIRGQGTGRQLVLAVEQEAIDRGGTTAITNTFSFQAPEFYKSLGYVEYGSVAGFGNRYQKHFLHKDLKRA